jgi:3-deoxy-D-manno-octulosonic-acid transferase
MKFLSIKNKKIRKWFGLRMNWKEELLTADVKNCIWFHAASVGEFEMAVPLIQEIRKHSEKQQIAVSFFSTSGFEFYKKHELVDVFFLLPKDFKQNIQFIINTIQPQKLIVIKNERWLNLIKTTHANHIPVYIVEAENKKYNIFYKSYINYINKFITDIFYSKDGSLQLERAKTVENKSFDDIKKYTEGHFTVILGSCYFEEVNLIARYYNKYQDIKIILCPHNIDTETFNVYHKLFNKKIGIYSKNELDTDILLIDKQGMLKYLYQYADMAFIGGGFSGKPHNIFEAAVCGKVVVSGTRDDDGGKNYVIDVAEKEGLICKIGHYNEFERLIKQYKNNPVALEINRKKWCIFFERHQNCSANIWKIIDYKNTNKKNNY